jgi:hypothetical protein
VVVLVAHDDPVLGVAADAGRPVQVPLAISGNAELVQELAFARVDLDPVVGAVGNLKVNRRPYSEICRNSAPP